MGIALCRFYTFVPHPFLDIPYVNSLFKVMRGKTMP